MPNHRVAVAFLMLVLLGLSGGWANAQVLSTPNTIPTRIGSQVPPPMATPPGEVRIGVFLYSVQQIDIARHSFRASFNVWWRYHGDDFDPIGTLQIVNAQQTSVILGDRRKLPNGDTYVVARVETTIEQVLDTSRFPFDRHRLQIVIESLYEDDYLQYVVDTTASMLDLEVYSPGWQITDFSIHEERKKYHTDFGLPERTNDEYSRAIIEVTAEHVGWALVIDYFIGFITSILICLLAFLVNPRLLPARATMIGTAVFAAVGNKYVVNSLTDASFGARPATVVVITAFSMVLILLLTSIACERMIEAGNVARANRLNRNIGVAAACGCLLVTLYVAWIAISA
ncbi:MAG: hypothetical protein ABI777_07420 [Betaproteobacteria bacterium]